MMENTAVSLNAADDHKHKNDKGIAMISDPLSIVTVRFIINVVPGGYVFGSSIRI